MPQNQSAVRALNLYAGEVRGMSWAVRELHEEITKARAAAQEEGLQYWLAEPLRYCEDCCRSAADLVNRYAGLTSTHPLAPRDDPEMSFGELCHLLAADVWEGLQDELPLGVNPPRGVNDEAATARAMQILQPVAARAGTLVGVMQGSESIPDEIMQITYQHEIGRPRPRPGS